MPVKFGNDSIASVKYGADTVEKAYKGASLVYGAKQYQDVLGESPSYQQIVPASAKNKAMLNMVGGASVVKGTEIVHADVQNVISMGTNMLADDALPEYNAAGLVYKPKSGTEWEIKGTPTAASYYPYSYTELMVLEPGTYTISIETNIPNVIYQTVVSEDGATGWSSSKIALNASSSYPTKTVTTTRKWYAYHRPTVQSAYGVPIDGYVKVKLEKGASPTPYTHYFKETYTLPYLPQDSWGIGNIYNERNFESGKRVQRVFRLTSADIIGCTDNGEGRFWIRLNKQIGENGNGICSTLTYERYANTNMRFGGTNTTPSDVLYLKNSNLVGVQALKDYVDSIELYLILAEPIETDLDASPITLTVEEGGTVTFENTPKLEVPNQTVYKVPLDALEAQISALYLNDVKEIENL